MPALSIVVDENIPRSTVDQLRALGHTVVDIRGTDREGSDDTILWDIAQQERALLITTDKGFALRQHEAHHGLLIVCLRQPNEQKLHLRVLEALRRFSEADWPGLTVLARDRVLRTWRFR